MKGIATRGTLAGESRVTGGHGPAPSTVASLGWCQPLRGSAVVNGGPDLSPTTRMMSNSELERPIAWLVTLAGTGRARSRPAIASPGCGCHNPRFQARRPPAPGAVLRGEPVAPASTALRPTTRPAVCGRACVRDRASPSARSLHGPRTWVGASRRVPGDALRHVPGVPPGPEHEHRGEAELERDAQEVEAG